MWSLPAQFGIDPSSSGSGGPPSIIKSINHISITIGSGQTSNTATISSVATGNCALFFLGSTTTSTTNSVTDGVCRVALTNSTTVTATRNNSSTTSTTVNCVLVEFTSNAINTSTQAGTITLSSQTSKTATISAVSSNAFVMWLGTSASSGYSGQMVGLQLTNSTTVTARLGVAGTATVGYMVVDLNAVAIKSVQKVSITNAQGVDFNIGSFSTLANTANSLLLFNGGTMTSNTNDADRSAQYAQLANGLTGSMSFAGNGQSTTSTYISYLTLIEFQPSIIKIGTQRGTIKITSATSNTATISSVTTSKAICNFLWFACFQSSTTGADTYLSKLALTNSTTVTYSVNTSNTTLIGSYEIIQFN